MLTTKRKPASVGEILIEEFMQPLELTQGTLAKAMAVPRKHVNELCNNRRTVTAPDPDAKSWSARLIGGKKMMFFGFVEAAIVAAAIVRDVFCSPSTTRGASGWRSVCDANASAARVF
jgi:hypothetical protein